MELLPEAARVHPLQAIALVIGLIGFAIAFVLQFRLKHHVSAERVLQLLDQPSALYPGQVPPRTVLDDAGKRLLTRMYVGGAIFLASIAVLAIASGIRPFGRTPP